MPSSAIVAKGLVVAHSVAAVRDRFRAALEQAGHRVVPVDNAAELLQRVASDRGDIDLVLVDLQLSNSRGAALISAIRAADEGRLPILAFSGTVGSADDVRAMASLRVEGYINEHCSTLQIVPLITPHLFPHSFDRRSGPRIVLGIPIQYRVGNTVAAALTLNIGRSGVGIRTTSALDAGTDVSVRFRLPGTESDIDADGRVAWSHGRVGMGIQFESVGAAAQSHIDVFVESHELPGRRV